VQDIEAEYVANKGVLSDATYNKLADAGASRLFVDGIINQAKSDAERESEGMSAAIVLEIKHAAGGPEEFDKAVVWARANLTADEIGAFNAAVDSGNKTLAMKAVKDLHTSFTLAEGKPPKLQKTEGKPSVAGESFGSWQEVQTAMRDRRYTNGDPMYHAEVERKLRNSNL